MKLWKLKTIGDYQCDFCEVRAYCVTDRKYEKCKDFIKNVFNLDTGKFDSVIYVPISLLKEKRF